MKHGIRQVDLAALIGYDQTYISAVESGLKGPPTDEFVSKLGQALALPPQELHELQTAADASQRKLVVDLDTPEDAYWLLKDLRDNFPTLSSTQIRVIRDVLRLSSNDDKAATEPVRRMKRRSRLEVTM